MSIHIGCSWTLTISAWLGARDIAHLKSHEISAFLGEGNKKKGDLYQAYQIAADPTEWEAEKDAEREAAEAEAAEEEEGVDELEDGDEAETGGKRKRAEPKKDAKKKKAKTETAGKKAKKVGTGPESADGRPTLETRLLRPRRRLQRPRLQRLTRSQCLLPRTKRVSRPKA